ncbi:MAG TPA: glycosyltransferase [Candidatus Methylacidiphilales bacterium]|nr:glycosyltransferase [Candidatus Methylacidiphilales bacterium]
MKFSIVTPSFKQPEWLRLCLASVADQKGDFEVEHIVQDNCSGETVAAVAGEFPGAQLISEQDKGMYDAVNRGLRRSTGDICAYLNCDEQYLPGALAGVAAFFKKHPEVDVVFGNCVLVKTDGAYFCSRPALYPIYYHARICHLSVFTAATFIRRRVFEKEGHYFDTSYRDLGDKVWVVGLFEKKIRFDVLDFTTSAFTETGDNMNMRPNAVREKLKHRAEAPTWVQLSAPFWAAFHRVRKLLAGHYSLKPFSYSIYTLSNPKSRTSFEVTKPTTVWRDRLSLIR